MYRTWILRQYRVGWLTPSLLVTAEVRSAVVAGRSRLWFASEAYAEAQRPACTVLVTLTDLSQWRNPVVQQLVLGNCTE